MAEWNYGDAGDRIPVADGDVWRVGPHLLVCGDLERGDAVKAVEVCKSLLGRGPDMFYSDPPWDKGNAKSFRTKAKVSRDVDFNAFMARVCEAAALVAGDVYIEMGNKHRPDMERWLDAAGIKMHRGWDIFYYGDKPMFMAYASVNGVDSSPPDFTGMDDAKTPWLAIEHSSEPGAVVFETCLGLGTTSRACQELGRVCLGMELNPRRMACSIDDLVKKYGLEAAKVGTIL